MVRCDEKSNQRGCNIGRPDEAYTNRSNNNGNIRENRDASHTSVSQYPEYTSQNIIERMWRYNFSLSFLKGLFKL